MVKCELCNMLVCTGTQEEGGQGVEYVWLDPRRIKCPIT